MEHLAAGDYRTDAPNRAMRKQRERQVTAERKAEAKKLASMSPLKRKRYQHRQWLDSVRGILLKVGNPLEDPKQTETSRSWFFRLGS